MSAHFPQATHICRLVVMLGAVTAVLTGCGGSGSNDVATQAAPQARGGNSLIAQGRHSFRFETFGDEAKWTDTLRLHEVIAAAVDPTTALSVGLKVDADALPQSVKDGILDGSVDLKSPATTLVLLQLDAVIGLKGRVDTENNVLKLKSVGTTCALCHSTVDNSFAPGIGKRLDGWPNRDLNVGMIIALSPAVPAAEKELLNKWGKGFYDPRHNVDDLNKPVVIPPAYAWPVSIRSRSLATAMPPSTSTATASRAELPTGTATSPSRRWAASAPSPIRACRSPSPTAP